VAVATGAITTCIDKVTSAGSSAPPHVRSLFADSPAECHENMSARPSYAIGGLFLLMSVVYASARSQVLAPDDPESADRYLNNLRSYFRAYA
jgi:hypothetical protein